MHAQAQIGTPRIRPLMLRPTTGPFVPSRSVCHYWFHCLNREIFERRLPTVQFRVNKEPTSWGYYMAPDIIGISPEYESKQQFVAILGHELVHHWQAHNGFIHHCHGSSFMRWVRKFRKHGIVLAEHGDVHMD